MRTFLAGMLLAVLGMTAFSPAVNAAEIPPTAECTALYKKVLADYPAVTNKKADRKAAMELLKGGCITDAEPLLRNMKAKPYSKECKIASRAAGEYWKPSTLKLRPLLRKYRVRWVPLDRRVGKLQRRILKLQRRDAAPARIRALTRKHASLKKKRRKMYRQISREANRIYIPQAYQTSLIYTELLSLRCVDQSSDLSEKNPRTPALRAIGRNRTLVFASLFYVAFKALDDAAAEKEASTSAIDTRALGFDEIPTGESSPAVPLLR